MSDTKSEQLYPNLKLDLSQMIIWDIIMLFSCAGQANNFLYEVLEDQSIQVYTQKYPHITDEEKEKCDTEELLSIDLPSDRYDWKIFRSIDVYTVNIPLDDQFMINNLIWNHPKQRIKKGLI